MRFYVIIKMQLIPVQLPLLKLKAIVSAVYKFSDLFLDSTSSENSPSDFGKFSDTNPNEAEAVECIAYSWSWLSELKIYTFQSPESTFHQLYVQSKTGTGNGTVSQTGIGVRQYLFFPDVSPQQIRGEHSSSVVQLLISENSVSGSVGHFPCMIPNKIAENVYSYQ